MGSAAGRALRELKEGPVVIQTRMSDFNMVTMQGPKGQAQVVPANTLVAFTATMFRELGEDTDTWEFRVPEDAPGGSKQTALIYLDGADIFLVKGFSKVL